jgi:hypothetical protein
VPVESGVPMTVDKTVAVFTSRDHAISEPLGAARGKLADASGVPALRGAHAWRGSTCAGAAPVRRPRLLSGEGDRRAARDQTCTIPRRADSIPLVFGLAGSRLMAWAAGGVADGLRDDVARRGGSTGSAGCGSGPRVATG